MRASSVLPMAKRPPSAVERESRGSCVVWRVSRWVGLVLRWFGLCAPCVCLAFLKWDPLKCDPLRQVGCDTQERAITVPEHRSCRVNVHTNHKP